MNITSVTEKIHITGDLPEDGPEDAALSLQKQGSEDVLHIFSNIRRKFHTIIDPGTYDAVLVYARRQGTFELNASEDLTEKLQALLDSVPK